MLAQQGKVADHLARHQRAHPGVRAALGTAGHGTSVRDFISRDLLMKIQDHTEEHVDFLETPLERIGKVDPPNCLHSQMGVATQGGRCESSARAVWIQCRPSHPTAHRHLEPSSPTERAAVRV